VEPDVVSVWNQPRTGAWNRSGPARTTGFGSAGSFARSSSVSMGTS
jgi:hypothetical protein